MAEDAAPTAYNLPDNSKKAKEEIPEEERTPLEQITTEPVIKRKKGLGRKFKEAMTGDDARSVGQYVFFDVIIPQLKNLLEDTINEGIHRALHGNVSGRARPIVSLGGGKNDYVPYNRVGSKPEQKALSSRARATHDFDEIILNSRGEAEMVLQGLKNQIQKYGAATVSDLYDLVGQSTQFTDNNWGWFSLAGSTVDRAGRQGYLLTLPAPEPLNKQ